MIADTGRGGRRRSSAERAVLWLLIGCVLLASSAYGVLLLLGPYVKSLGGNEATYGVLCAVAAPAAAVALLLLLRYPRRVAPHRLLAGACLLYAAAALLAASTGSVGGWLVTASIVLGTAWSVTYTAAPMIASDLATDADRATLIGYATGTIQAGFGVGPVLGNALRRAGLSYQEVFVAGAGLALAAALLVIPLAACLRRLSSAGHSADGAHHGDDALPVPGPGPRASEEREPARTEPAVTTTRAPRLPRSPSVVPLAMVLLCACIFTSMNSFQTTFADSRDLDFDLFYVTYTIAVIAVRLGLSRFLRDSASDRVVAVTTVGMMVAVTAFVFVGSSPVLYCLASLALGCTYGLGLPAFQARAVNLAGPAERARMLPMAGLLFEVSILVFPLVAGAIVSSGGYRGLFAVLLAITAVVTALGQLRGRPFERSPTGRPSGLSPGSPESPRPSPSVFESTHVPAAPSGPTPPHPRGHSD
ncbi:MFS transporter [Frankia sp. CiP3]|uniref:MFS transporter n=2 Tax=Frankia sp. CiP3 TaxID=2880971 RepID=UPI001EF53D97|nr:MFS transporter [Frankia sp. CiP3]